MRISKDQYYKDMAKAMLRNLQVIANIRDMDYHVRKRALLTNTKVRFWD